jgi:hypothetical protein
MNPTQTDQLQIDTTGRTAEIIPFPVRSPEPAVLLPQDRLTRALASLNAALAEQRVAVAAWRDNLADLKASTGGLGESLEQYRTSLGNLGQGIETLQTQAHALRNWADKAVPTQAS